jgi:hypothetical protein
MSGTPSKTGARLASLAVLLVLGAIVYAFSPLFLPRWRWENLDPNWDKLALAAKLPAAKLQSQYDIVVRYKPRGDQDPVPWQVITCSPAVDPENEVEFQRVRVTLVSDRTGEPPSALRLGSLNYRDIFFKGKAWRFPPGSLPAIMGFNRARPVFVYDASTFDKLDSNEAFRMDGEMKESKWTDDDSEIVDGYRPPGAPAAE